MTALSDNHTNVACFSDNFSFVFADLILFILTFE